MCDIMCERVCQTGQEGEDQLHLSSLDVREAVLRNDGLCDNA